MTSYSISGWRVSELLVKDAWFALLLGVAVVSLSPGMFVAIAGLFKVVDGTTLAIDLLIASPLVWVVVLVSVALPIVRLTSAGRAFYPYEEMGEEGKRNTEKLVKKGPIALLLVLIVTSIAGPHAALLSALFPSLSLTPEESLAFPASRYFAYASAGPAAILIVAIAFCRSRAKAMRNAPRACGMFFGPPPLRSSKLTL